MNTINIVIIATTFITIASCEHRASVKPEETLKQSTNETVEQELQVTGNEVYKYAKWEGTWVGVEGMFLEVKPREPGQYSLIMQSDLDTYGTYDGVDSEQGINFTREDKVLSLRKANGDETGLKYLAGKKDCLMVMSGEGYCRD